MAAARQQDSFLDKVRPRRPHRWQPPYRRHTHRGAGRGHAEAATAAAAATRRFTGCIPAKAKDDFKTKDPKAKVKIFYN